MTPAAIRFALDTAGLTQSELATSLDVGDAIISMTINGTRKAPRVRRHIASAIGRSYEEVWGEPDPAEAGPNDVNKFTPPDATEQAA